MDAFRQAEYHDPETPTRPRRRAKAPPEAQLDTEMEEEDRTMAEAEAIVVYQLKNLRRELQHFSDHHIWGARAMDIAYKVARKFMPELIAAGEKQSVDGNADSSRVLQETAELRSTVKELAKVVNTLVARQEALPTQNGGNQRGPTEIQGVKTVIATGPVYKPTKVSTTNARPTQNRQTFTLQSPKDRYHPARLIVIPHGEKFDTNQLNPRRVVNLINNRLASLNNAKHLCVASAHYNYNQNLVIMLREDQKGEELRQHAGVFVDIFGVLAHTIEMITDDRQYKVRINGVWTGRDGKNDLNTPEDLLEEIERFNPVMLKVTLMGKPRWMHAEADLRRKDYSSVVLEFAKEEDAKTVLAARYITMYTNFCEVVHHADRSPVLQCSKCWALGHHVSRCKNLAKCRLCAGSYSETEHRQEEYQQMLEDEPDQEGSEQRNKNTEKCANCGGNHPATERKCPERIRYQTTARERETGKTNRGITVRKRKGNTRGRDQATGSAGAVGASQRTDQTGASLQATTGEKTTNNATSETSANVAMNRNTNKFMALKNLLNQNDRMPETWAEEMEGQEYTEQQTYGNVPSL
ncbi:hypothetical protein C0992_005124 [Termitomyces sp. T32_za158]|nr:hypothetical protein C0992_005124 [Termitomyces sp. T32_za158]